jgi:teichuronic acid biosynthesis glycosyltransferase TuaG
MRGFRAELGAIVLKNANDFIPMPECRAEGVASAQRGAEGDSGHEPLVSVIIPAYNCAEFIPRTLESVIRQSYKNLEILVLADPSSDDTEELVKRYEALDKRIAYLRNAEHLGVAETRNEGVRRARGEWIAFVDSDDIWERDKIQLQLAWILENKTFFSCTGRALIDVEGRDLRCYIGLPEQITYKNLLGTNSVVCSSVICERKILLEFPMEGGDIHEDYLAWLQITKKYGAVGGIDRPLVQYRLRGKSRSSNKARAILKQYRTYRKVEKFLPKIFYCLFLYAINGLMKYKGALRKSAGTPSEDPAYQRQARAQ